MNSIFTLASQIVAGKRNPFDIYSYDPSLVLNSWGTGGRHAITANGNAKITYSKHSTTANGDTNITHSKHDVTANGDTNITYSNHDVTANGDTEIITTTIDPFGNSNGVADFDGSDELQIPDSTAFDFTATDCTIEFWIRATSLAGVQGILGQYYNTQDWGMYLYSDGNIAIGQAGVTEIASTTSPITLNNWHFVQVVKSSGTTTIYVDGISVASASTSWATNASNPLRIGYTRYNSTDFYFVGQLSDIQLSNISRSVSVPTEPLTPDANSLLMLPLNNEYQFEDISLVDPFNNLDGVAVFDGVGDYLNAPLNPAFNLYGKNWTIETYFKTSGLNSSQYCLFHVGGDNANAMICYIDNQRLYFDVRVSNSTIISIFDSNIGDFNPNTNWHHLAVVRNGTSWAIYLDGILHNSTTSGSDINDASKEFNIGLYKTIDYYWKGQLSNFRITETALYTSDFAPPTEPLTPDQNSSLMLPLNTERQFDDISLVDPFGNLDGVAVFDGNDSVSSTSLINFGSGDFAIELHIYLTAYHKADLLGTGYSSSGWLVYMHSAGEITIYNNASQVIVITGAINLNQWNRIILSRTGTTLTLKVNTSVNTVAYSTAFDAGKALYIGYDLDDNFYFNGYMSNLRFSKCARSLDTPTKALTADEDTIFLAPLNTRYQFDDISLVDPFGNINGVMSLDGTVSYLTVPYSSELSISHANTTAECFMRWNSISNTYNVVFTWNGTNAAQFIYECGSNYFYIWTAAQSYNFNSFTPSLDTWYHIALVDNNGTLTLYINGTSYGSHTSNIQLNDDTFYVSWTATTHILNGQISNVRISNVARYTTTFTPPVEPFVPDENTVLLQPMTGQNNSTAFVDYAKPVINEESTAPTGAVAKWNFTEDVNDSAGTNNGTLQGDASIVGNVLNLDGSGDYVSVSNDSSYPVSTNPFTVSLWTKDSNVSTDNTYIGNYESGSSTNSWFIWRTSSLFLFQYSTNGSDAADVRWNIVLSQSTWTHIVIKRAGTTQSDWKLFINGVDQGLPSIGTYNGAIYDSSDDIYIGDVYGSLASACQMSRIGIYNNALSATQVQDLYNAEKKYYLEPVIPSWKDGTDYYNHALQITESVRPNLVPNKLDGKYGIKFARSNSEFMTAPAVTSGAKTLLTSFWIKFDSLSDSLYYAILHETGDTAYTHRFYMLITLNRYLVTAMRDTSAGTQQSATSAVQFTTGVWYHIVSFIDTINDRMYLYINNSLDYAVVKTMGPIYASTSVNGLNIGKEATNYGGDHFLDGELADLIVVKDKIFTVNELETLVSKLYKQR